MKNLILYVTIIILFLSCQQETNSIEKTLEDKKIFVSQTKEKTSSNFIWSDDLLDENTFSKEFDEIINSESQIIQYFEIFDVYEKNNKAYVVLEVDFAFIFELEINNISLSELIKIGKQDSFEHSCLLIVKIEEIKKIPLMLKANGDDFPDIYYEYSSTNIFYGKGNLLTVECDVSRQ